jgi:hypothetical protein
MKYFSNTTVSEITTVSNILMCLSMTKAVILILHYYSKHAVFLKFWENWTSFTKTEVLLCQVVKYNIL